MTSNIVLGLIISAVLTVFQGCKRMEMHNANEINSESFRQNSSDKNDTELTAVVRRYAKDGTTSGNFVVLHPIDKPLLGGIIWLNAPELEVDRLLNQAKKNEDVIVKVNIRYCEYPTVDDDLSNSYEPPQINPLTDPLSQVCSIGSVRFMIVSKIEFPPVDINRDAK